MKFHERSAKGPHPIIENCFGTHDKEHSQFVGQVNHFRLYRCQRCGLIFIWPIPSEKEIGEFYSTYHVDTGQFHLSEAGETGLFRSVLQLIAEWSTTGEILDIGSSYGYFLAQARERGFGTVGIEIAEEPARYSREIMKLEIHSIGLQEVKFKEGRFAAITMLNVLEHLPEPQSVLLETYRITKRGGGIVIVVPNVLLSYPIFRIVQGLGLKKRIPGSAFDIPAHLSVFSPASLYNTLSLSGWKQIKIENAPVIRNKNILRTTFKSLVRGICNFIAVLTGGNVVLGYSLIATARKE